MDAIKSPHSGSEVCYICQAACAEPWHLVCPACWARTPQPLQDELCASLKEAVALGEPTKRHSDAIHAVLAHLTSGKH